MSLPEKGGKKSWRGAERDPEQAKAAKRMRTIYILLGIIAFGVGSFGAFLALARPFDSPYLMTFTVPGYLHYPPIPFVDQDVEAIEKLWEKGTLLRPGKQMAVDKASQNLVLLRNKLSSELDKSSEKPKKPVVMIVIGYAHLVDGKVMMLASDSQARTANQGLPLQDILLKLKAIKAEKKLLILDLMRPLRSARHGILKADVAAAVKAELDANPDEGRIVITACAPGQVSHFGEEINRSVFGYYLERGLKGAADGWNRGNKVDDRISVKELFHYTAFHVQRYVEKCRDQAQTPTIHPEDASDKLDFALRAAPKSGRKIDPPAVLPGAFPVKAWQSLDPYREQKIYRDLPTVFSRWQRRLLEEERKWRYGEVTVAPEPVEEDADKKKDAAKSEPTKPEGETKPEKEKEKKPPPIGELDQKIMADLSPKMQSDLAEYQSVISLPESRSLAQEMARQGKVVSRESLNAWAAMARLIDPEKPIPEDVLKKITETLGALKERPIERQAFLFAALAEEPAPTQARLRLYVDWIEPKDQPGPRRPFFETIFLRQLADLKREPWPLLTVQKALRVVRDGEQLLAGDYRTWQKLQPLIHAADQKRHEAQWLLFAAGYASIEDVDRAYDACIEEMNRVQTWKEQLSRAYETRDEALLILPYFGAFLAALPMEGEAQALADQWSRALRSAAELESQLAPLMEGPPTDNLPRRITQLSALSSQLQGQLRGLRDRLEGQRLREIIDLARQSPTPQVWSEATAMLEWPFYPGEVRQQLWQARLDLAKRLRDRVDSLDVEDDKQPHFQPTSPIARAPLRDEVQARHAARLSLEWMSLTGAEATAKLRELLALTEDKPELWGLLSQEMEKAWSVDVPELVHKEDALQRDRLLRLLDFSGTSLVAATLDAFSPRARMSMERARQHWLGENDTYLSVEWGDHPALAEFLDRMAQRYRSAGAAAPPDVRVVSGGRPIELKRGDRSELILALSGLGRAAIQPLAIDPVWLNVEVPKIPGDATTEGPTSYNQPIIVRKQTGAENHGNPPPQGFVLVARFKDRARHLKLDTALPPSLANRPRLHASFHSSQAGDAIGQIRLRPNQTTPIYLFVSNPSGKDQDLTVELWDGDRPLPAPGGKKDVFLAATETMKKVEWDAPPPQDLEQWPTLRQKWIVKLRDKKQPASEPLDERPLAIHVMTPGEYLQLAQATFHPGARPRFEIILKQRGQEPMNPPCKVELIVELKNTITDEITTLRKQGQITEEGETMLSVENIRLPSLGTLEGKFVVNVDGYARAFRGTFTTGGNAPSDASLEMDPLLQLQMPAFIEVGQSVPVQLEADGIAPRQIIEIAVGRSEKGPFNVLAPLRFAGGREVALRYSPGSGDKGGLLIHPVVRDWRQTLKLPEGDRDIYLRCRLIDQQGQEPADFEPIIRKIEQEDQPPTITRIEALALEDDQLTVVVEGKKNVAPIKEVKLFVGQPTEEGKRPERIRTIDAQVVGDGQPMWTAKLRLDDPDRKSVYVTAIMINAAEMERLKPALINLEALRKKDAAETAASLGGKVVRGDRGQPGETVTLIDAKGVTHTQKTGADGSFSFANLPPGPYRLNCSQLGTTAKGQMSGVLKPGKNDPVTLVLRL